MSILIVDDSEEFRRLIERLLNKNGYQDLQFANTAEEAYKLLGVDGTSGVSDDTVHLLNLILMDEVMPGDSGIEACRRIKAVECLVDIPIIMLTASDDDATLEEAFEAGASDYLRKPPKKVEFIARVNSALEFKREVDRRRIQAERLEVLTEELAEANARLKRQSLVDGLTGVENRRSFDDSVARLHAMAMREQLPFGLIFIDIDFFKLYNDTYGHILGDECLKLVAERIKGSLKRTADIVARYGGEEFVVLLPGTDIKGTRFAAQKIRANVEALELAHSASTASEYVTISLGVASVVPTRTSSVSLVIDMADKALYRAKEQGRNRVEESS
ncbi:MAG: diguanylate cyclase [Proteobacteria bacterium]|nr:diguanylate cyclase [Pseudomonadota bacterium]